MKQSELLDRFDSACSKLERIAGALEKSNGINSRIIKWVVFPLIAILGALVGIKLW